MSGNSSDIISILKHNEMYHGEAVGLVVGQDELFSKLEARNFPVSPDVVFPIDRFDFIVIDYQSIDAESLLNWLSYLRKNGIMILDITYTDYDWKDKYVSEFGGFFGTKVKFGVREYLVIKEGTDYGN